MKASDDMRERRRRLNASLFAPKAPAVPPGGKTQVQGDQQPKVAWWKAKTVAAEQAAATAATAAGHPAVPK